MFPRSGQEPPLRVSPPADSVPQSTGHCGSRAVRTLGTSCRRCMQRARSNSAEWPKQAFKRFELATDPGRPETLDRGAAIERIAVAGATCSTGERWSELGATIPLSGTSPIERDLHTWLDGSLAGGRGHDGPALTQPRWPRNLNSSSRSTTRRTGRTSSLSRPTSYATSVRTLSMRASSLLET